MRKRMQIGTSAPSEGCAFYPIVVEVIKRSLERLNSRNIALHAGIFVVKLPDDFRTAFRAKVF